MSIATSGSPGVQALIMAGGQSERLYPLTASRPKPAVAFGGIFRIVDFTADAVFQNSALLGDRGMEIVLILSADQVCHMDYRKLLRYHADTNADLTIATVDQSVTVAKEFGVVELDSEQRVAGLQEKPSNPRFVPSRHARARISMGVYAFKRKALVQALSENCSEGMGI